MERGVSELHREICAVFRSADAEGKGYLTREDYKVAVIQLMGYKPSKHEIITVWKRVEPGEGLKLEEFTQFLLPRLQQQDSSEQIRQIFMAFDRFCRGFISLDDCKAAFTKVHKLKPQHHGHDFMFLLGSTSCS